MLSESDYRDLIIDALFNSELIDRTLYLKCNQAVTDLPYDLRTTDIDELKERMDTIDEEINTRDTILQDAEYRMGVKQRDIERLEKRISKSQERIDKAIDSINSESDKIVKGIEKLETKISKLEDTDNIESAIDRFKKAHNNFFDMDLTPNNIKSYQSALEDYKNASDNLNKVLKTAFDEGLINKTDLNNGDISKNIARIDKNINTFSKNNDDMAKDGQKIKDNFNDIDYIARQSKTVVTSRDALSDEYDRTLQVYLDNGGDRSVKPGFNQSGHGTNIPEFIDEMSKLQKQLGKKYPYLFT